MSDHLKELLGVLYTPGAAEVSEGTDDLADERAKPGLIVWLLLVVCCRLGGEQLLEVVQETYGLLPCTFPSLSVPLAFPSRSSPLLFLLPSPFPLDTVLPPLPTTVVLPQRRWHGCSALLPPLLSQSTSRSQREQNRRQQTISSDRLDRRDGFGGDFGYWGSGCWRDHGEFWMMLRGARNEEEEGQAGGGREGEGDGVLGADLFVACRC